MRRHISDTQRWLQSFSSSEQRDLARYVPDIHAIYRNAIRYGGVDWSRDNVRDVVEGIGRIEALTGFAYPFQEYAKAVKEGDAPRVQAFLDGGVLREAWSRGMPLYTAAENGHMEVVDVLLAAGEPLNFAGCRAPLLAALGAGQWAMALKLIRMGADLTVVCRNKPGVGDVLTRWARAGNLDLLTAFFEAGVPVDTLNRQGTTALAEAAAIGRRVMPVDFWVQVMAGACGSGVITTSMTCMQRTARRCVTHRRRRCAAWPPRLTVTAFFLPTAARSGASSRGVVSARWS